MRLKPVRFINHRHGNSVSEQDTVQHARGQRNRKPIAVDSNTPQCVKKLSCLLNTKYIGISFIFAVFVSTTSVNAASAKDRSTIPTATLLDAIANANAPKPIKSALRTNIAVNPKGSGAITSLSWVGDSGEFSYVLTALRYESKAKTLAASITKARCFAELIYRMKPRIDPAKTAPSDLNLLSSSLLNESQTAFAGAIEGAFHSTLTANKWTITLAYCPRDKITAHVTQSQNLERLRRCYSNAGLRRISLALKCEDWKSAELTWEHLRDIQLLSPKLVVEYGKCLLRQKRTRQAINHFAKYLDGYSDLQDKNYFLDIAQLLSPLASKERDAELIAIQAYDNYEKLEFGITTIRRPLIDIEENNEQ